jgi:hypothetical protein
MAIDRKYAIRNKSTGKYLHVDFNYPFWWTGLPTVSMPVWKENIRHYALDKIEEIVKIDVQRTPTKKKLKNSEIVAFAYCEVPTTVKLEKMTERISQKELVRKLKDGKKI